jgi:hypothetical protein
VSSPFVTGGFFIYLGAMSVNVLRIIVLLLSSLLIFFVIYEYFSFSFLTRIVALRILLTLIYLIPCIFLFVKKRSKERKQRMLNSFSDDFTTSSGYYLLVSKPVPPGNMAVS